MQDYPHYKYRPRRKKKDKTGANQPKVNDGDGQPKRQPQPPEPAYLQRVAVAAAAAAAAAASSKENGDEADHQRLIRLGYFKSYIFMLTVLLDLFCRIHFSSKTNFLSTVFHLEIVTVHQASTVCMIRLRRQNLHQMILLASTISLPQLTQLPAIHFSISHYQPRIYHLTKV